MQLVRSPCQLNDPLSYNGLYRSVTVITLAGAG
jgi:hypothetical protein